VTPCELEALYFDTAVEIIDRTYTVRICSQTYRNYMVNFSVIAKRLDGKTVFKLTYPVSN